MQIEKKGKEWTEPQELNDQINMPGYTSTHPTVGRESKRNQEVLYFVSDRPGSRGGLDIWYTEFDGRKKVFKNVRSETKVTAKRKNSQSKNDS